MRTFFKSDIAVIELKIFLNLHYYCYYSYHFYHYYNYNYYYYKCYSAIIITVNININPFGRFFILGCCELKEEVSTQTYLYNLSIQPSRECLVINWMVNSCYGPYQL